MDPKGLYRWTRKGLAPAMAAVLYTHVHSVYSTAAMAASYQTLQRPPIRARVLTYTLCTCVYSTAAMAASYQTLQRPPIRARVLTYTLCTCVYSTAAMAGAHSALDPCINGPYSPS